MRHSKDNYKNNDSIQKHSTKNQKVDYTAKRYKASGKDFKHDRNAHPSRRKQQRKRLRILLLLLIIAIADAGITIYRDYMARPGFLEKVWISERGADHITVSWEQARNVSKYVIKYDDKTIKVSGHRKYVRIENLDENTEYEFSVRADSKKREGFETLTAKARTKKAAHISGEKVFTRFANRPTDLKQEAETQVTYLPGNGYTVNEEGMITFTKAGQIIVTAKTEETSEYALATKEITVNVLDTINVDADKATQHLFYKLTKDNCECVMTIEGDGEAVTPQSFIRYNGQYMIAYMKGNVQRIITYGDGKKVYEPKQSLGHANGLTIAKGKCYLVEAFTAKCTTFDPPNSNYSSFELPANTSGIAYDEKNDIFYTNERKRLSVYDNKLDYMKSSNMLVRKDKYYVQDCGAYGEILMSCISSEDYMGTNYIDFYDMQSSTYLGSVECELNELESIIVDEEGYIELLCNAKGKTDYIWKTPINMKVLCD